jgi:hypothetical protein
MGSTVVMLFEKGTFRVNHNIATGMKIRMGQEIGKFR